MKKGDVLEAIRARTQEKLDELLAALDKLQESMEGEEKNTAGDKFETARAMAQNEIDQLNRQIGVVRQDLVVLHRLSPDLKCQEGQMGAIISLESKTLFISVAQGRTAVGKEEVFAVSPNSPIGREIIGKKSGDVIKMGNKEERIRDIQ